MKDELRENIANKIVRDERAKDTKKCVIKRKPKFENYKNCLEATKLEIKLKYLEKSKINIVSLKKFIKNSLERINQYYKHSKDLKAKDIMFLLKKLIKFCKFK